MIPETITICGVPHKIELCKDNFTMDAHFGEIKYTEARIRINEDMPESMQEATLVHEWLHGALVMLGFNDTSNDEQFVTALATAINMTFSVRAQCKEKN